MVVRTHTPRVLKARRSIVELMVANHPQDCLVCDRSGELRAGRLTREVGAGPSSMRG